MSDNENDIKIVTGDSSDLDISAVGEHLKSLKPKGKEQTKKEIVIPNVKSDEKKTKK